MAGYDAIDPQAGPSNRFIKLLRLVVDPGGTVLVLKGMEQNTFKDESLPGKIDGQIAIGMWVGHGDDFHPSFSIRDGASIFDRLHPGLLTGLSQPVWSERVGTGERLPDDFLVLDVGQNGSPCGGVGADASNVIGVVVGGDQIAG